MKRNLFLIAIFAIFAMGANAQFSEDFSSVTANENVELDGWTNFAEEGTRVFIGKYFADENNYYAQMSAYNSTEASEKAWLITPALTIGGANELTFISKYAFNNADVSSLWISTNFTGDVTSANWTELSFTEPTDGVGGYGAWTGSGSVDLSAYTGQKVNIAFKYTGGDPSATTIWQVDDVMITGTLGLVDLMSTTKIFPNPVSSVLNISSENQISSVELLNVIGQRISTQEVNSQTTTINTANLVKGVYFAKVNNANGTSTITKIVKR